MKPKCINCKYIINLLGEPPICQLKSWYSRLPFDRIKVHESKTCVNERLDSKGFFGLFKDKTRCGVNAKNFEENK